jgi:hypothetical protein
LLKLEKVTFFKCLIFECNHSKTLKNVKIAEKV